MVVFFKHGISQGNCLFFKWYWKYNYEFLWAFKLHPLDPIQTCYYSKGVICGVRLEQNLDLLKASKWRSVKKILKFFAFLWSKQLAIFLFPTINLTNFAKLLENLTTFPISKFWKGKGKKKPDEDILKVSAN